MERETYLTFLIGEDYFAVNVKKVLEVLEKQKVTQVPKAPDYILGIINFRGQILPVIDTRKKFGIAENESNGKKAVIVYEIKNEAEVTTIAATADGVKDVIEIDDNEIKPIPEIGISYDTHFIRGAVNRNDKFILLIDIEKILSLSASEQIDQHELIN